MQLRAIQYRSIAKLHMCVGCESKIEILRVLALEPCNVKSLSDTLALSQSSISHHLAAMRNCHLVLSVRRSQISVYRLSPLVSVVEHPDCVSVEVRCEIDDSSVRVTVPVRHTLVHAQGSVL
ncbi:MAG: winged helix-turn-helix transcriptional regulator [Phycisphaeraceae bacterium]|nr:winged helix-turn-helix transcriptional regulator [Phycisphaeraceae bacterium]MCW5764277.1 winged helix-turn-helix transcriptional regulator [Phycisphaeraceae bacterium]